MKTSLKVIDHILEMPIPHFGTKYELGDKFHDVGPIDDTHDIQQAN